MERSNAYFVLQKFGDCVKAFEEGYYLYGAMLSNGYPTIQPSLGVYHWYRGTFVSVNLTKLRMKFLTTPIQQTFYGVEGFFGNLCEFEKCYNAHEINISLYKNEYKPEYYKN